MKGEGGWRIPWTGHFDFERRRDPNDDWMWCCSYFTIETDFRVIADWHLFVIITAARRDLRSHRSLGIGNTAR